MSLCSPLLFFYVLRSNKIHRSNFVGILRLQTLIRQRVGFRLLRFFGLTKTPIRISLHVSLFSSIQQQDSLIDQRDVQVSHSSTDVICS